MTRLPAPRCVLPILKQDMKAASVAVIGCLCCLCVLQAAGHYQQHEQTVRSGVRPRCCKPPQVNRKQFPMAERQRALCAGKIVVKAAGEPRVGCRPCGFGVVASPWGQGSLSLEHQVPPHSNKTCHAISSKF